MLLGQEVVSFTCPCLKASCVALAVFFPVFIFIFYARLGVLTHGFIYTVPGLCW